MQRQYLLHSNKLVLTLVIVAALGIVACSGGQASATNIPASDNSSLTLTAANSAANRAATNSAATSAAANAAANSAATNAAATGAAAASAAQSTSGTTVADAALGPGEVSVASMMDANDRLLVWVANGPGPGQQGASDPGQLMLMDSTGATTSLIDVPPQTSKVTPCGDHALSPNGRFFMLYLGLVGDQGLQSGSLYTMTDGQAPVLLHDAPLLTCLGNGTFQYSPDSARLAYIDYAPGAATDTFAHGFLHIVNTADMSEVTTFESVTAFTVANDGIAFISFFTNDRGNADEAAVTWWDGNIDHEITTLTPTDQNCFFTNATLTATPDGKLLAVLGHRCTRGDTSTNWQLYSIDRTAKSATLISSSPQPGAFTSFTRSNNVYVAPNGSTAYFTIPDGVTANTVGISSINLSNASITPVINRQAVFPTFQGAANAFPRVSPDGNWLAMVVTSPNSDNNLTVINLNDPTAAPISVSAGSRGDTISTLAFTPDSSHVVYIGGGDNNANNSLFSLDLASGSETRVHRGRYAQGFALSPAGTEVAIMDWQFLEDPNQPPYIKLEVINLDTNEVATLFTGADIVDNKVQNQRFAWPMLWLRTGG